VTEARSIRRPWIRRAAYVGAVLLALGVGQDYFVFRPNRAAIVAVMGDLRLGMTRQEVTSALRSHNAERLIRRHDDAGVFLVAHTGVARSWEMGIAFQEDHLRSARVWTEDGPYHPADVPADIQELPQPSPEGKR
jgi:hypothetical protein